MLHKDKGTKKIQWRKNCLFNKWCWGNWTATYKRMKSTPYPIPYRNINSKWIVDLDLRAKTITLLEKVVHLHDPELGKGF